MYLFFYIVEYSCFGYFLGVYEIVRWLIDELFIGYDVWDNKDRLLVLCVVLLYDLGYGLFLYSFEKIFNIDYEVYI